MGYGGTPPPWQKLNAEALLFSITLQILQSQFFFPVQIAGKLQESPDVIYFLCAFKILKDLKFGAISAVPYDIDQKTIVWIIEKPQATEQFCRGQPKLYFILQIDQF